MSLLGFDMEFFVFYLHSISIQLLFYNILQNKFKIMSEVKNVDTSGSKDIKSEERSKKMAHLNICVDDGDAKPPPCILSRFFIRRNI